MKNKKFYPTLLLIAILSVVGFTASNVLSSSAFAANEIDTSKLSSMFGGGSECGCETDSQNCSEYALDCTGAAQHGGTCTRCANNSQEETCHDWGFCIGSSCSECQVDAPVECGTRTVGTCQYSTQSCINQINFGNCGTATKCTTVGGW